MSGNVIGQGAFDNAHDWTGDEPTEPESTAFQEGKARALKKLLPYAHAASYHEAAAVVLQWDGSEWDFQEGPRDHVNVRVPTMPGMPVALLHSHPHVLAHSVDDWQIFLLTDNIVQSHVVTDGKTYSLHKPSGWQLPPDASAIAISDVFYAAIADAFNESEGRGEMPDDSQEREAALRTLAQQYGVQYRIGTHLSAGRTS